MKNSKKLSMNTIMLLVAIVSLLYTPLLGLSPGTQAIAATGNPAFEHAGATVLSVGESYPLVIINEREGARYEWSSSNESVATVSQDGLVEAVAVGTATISCQIMMPNKTEIIRTIVVVNKGNQGASKRPSNPEVIPVDQDGFDANGRMVAYFGSPVIDGEIDRVWDYAVPVTPKHVSGNISTSATFKALWDDYALYILAEVKDKDLSVQSGTPYMQDSMEIFLDENNEKTQDYGVDDMHLRVNVDNVQSIDNGAPERFYTAAKKVDGGYIIEARVALKHQPDNGKVLGIELQINDASETERIGTINVFDSSGNAWNDTSKFGEIILTGKTKDGVSGTNPYDLINLMKRAQKLDLSLYTNAHIILEAIVNISESVLIGGDITQQQLDEQYATLEDAISRLEMTEEAANEKYFEPVPDEYRLESAQPGTIETLTYSVPNLENGIDDKRLHVYLPYGYDTTDTQKKYNVLYLMHGGGENEDLIFGGPGQSKELKKIIDNMIANGDIEPLIVVTPTFYGGKNDTALFHDELINDIVPLVETKYHTYAESGSSDDLQASRAHRAFGGFSMGSVTTWNVFATSLDYFKYYIPLSGDSWVLGERSGGLMPKETAEYLANVVRESVYAPHDYYIFSATGDLDIAYPNLKPQIDAMKELTDVFIYSSDLSKGNFYFIDAEGGTHHWNWQNQYIYDILFDLFVDEN